MIEVTIRYVHRTGDKKGEKGEYKTRIGKRGDDVPVEKLVALAYQNFARRDIDVIEPIEAVHWVPRQLNITMSDGGMVQIQEKGKKQKRQFSLDGSIVENIRSLDDDDYDQEEIAQRTSHPVKEVVCQPEPVSQEVLESPKQESQIEKPLPSIQRTRVEVNPRNGVRMGEELYNPTPDERRRGITQVTVFNPQKRLQYAPIVHDERIPISPNSIIYASEMHKTQKYDSRTGSNVVYYIVQTSTGTVHLPESSVIEAPEGNDPFLMRGMGRINEDKVVDKVGDEEVYEEVSLQKGKGMGGTPNTDQQMVLRPGRNTVGETPQGSQSSVELQRGKTVDNRLQSGQHNISQESLSGISRLR